ncbi:MAG: DNA primase [Rhodospirillales bacterium]
MAFSPAFLDELRVRSSLSDVIGKRVQLKKAGGRGEWSGLCPFHNEKTPSFTVSDDKGFYHCFGCGEHGSVFDFVMKTEGLSFPEAVERLAHDAGLEVPRDTPEERRRQEKRKTLVDVTEAAAQYFQRMLRMPEGKAALDYLHGRGVDDETIRTFRLGFAPDARGALKAALTKDGFTDEMMVEAGLLIVPPEERQDRTPYDRFRGRVMFPIADKRGNAIAFGGRAMGDAEPKYLNSPETPIFHKGRVLYALDHALAPARKSGRLIVCEGYMDVIALHRAGIAEAVAPLGTALTEEHLTELWRVVPEPLLCFDGDNAGQRAAGRAAERALPALKAGIGLRFAELPKGHDPDTLIRDRGTNAMEHVIAAAQPLSEIIWRMELGERAPTTPEGRAALQSRLSNHTRRIEDPSVRGQFTQTFKDRIWQLGRTGGRKGQQRDKADPASLTLSGPQTGHGDPVRRRLEILLACLINHPEIYDTVGEKLGALDFSKAGPDLDNLRQQALKTLARETGLETGALADHLTHLGLGAALTSLTAGSVLLDAYFARSEAPLDEALSGWNETYALLRAGDLMDEIREAEQVLAEEFSDEAWQRVKALKQQQHQNNQDGI